MAACSLATRDFLMVGKLLTIASFLACVVLLYFLTRSLWHSELVAALAAIWFTLGRGLIPMSVQMVSPDFLLTLLVIAYGIVLLRCIRRQKRWDWLALGGIHAVAFLDKAIALPWLGLVTFLAIALSFEKHFRRALTCLCLAALLPSLVATAWAGILYSKYRVFTTGTQFRANLIQNTIKDRLHVPHEIEYRVLRDISQFSDQYGVVDPIPPKYASLRLSLPLSQVLPKIIQAEGRNIPAALKEIILLTTPGGVCAFVIGMAVLTQNRRVRAVEFQFIWIIFLGILGLMLAYCMLVFDNRYALPTVPLIIAMASGFLLPSNQNNPLLPRFCRIVCIGLVCAGLVFTSFYWSSPFRTLDRDFQLSCYDAAEKLRLHPGMTVVGVGEGPYPEHGVGWEAVFDAAFFADREVIAQSDRLPAKGNVAVMMADIKTANPDAVMIWGSPRDAEYENLTAAVSESYGGIVSDKITDPSAGEVGTIFFPPSPLP
jgi:hypothetical protein